MLINTILPHAARLTLCAGLSIISGASAWATTQAAGDKPAYDAARAEAAQQYKRALSDCGKLAVRDKDICQITAKTERTKREQRAEAFYKGTPQAAHQARLAIAQADLEASLRFCAQRNGSVSRACKLEAREQFNRAKTEADEAMRDGRPIDQALGDSAGRHPNDPRACDTLDGGAKHACLARAKGTVSSP